MLTSVEVFWAYRQVGDPDPGRIAAQVVSGIGFLGAGTILREGVTVRGLTTAASLWVVAALGLAVGSGLYLGAVVVTMLALATLAYLARVESSLFAERSRRRISLLVADRPGIVGRVGSILESYGVRITNLELNQETDHEITLSLNISIPRRVRFEAVIDELLALEGVKTYAES